MAHSVIERISEKKKAVEINTGGMVNPVGRPYLSQELLNYAVELGVDVTFGSDAHKPEILAAHFGVATKMLEAAGATIW